MKKPERKAGTAAGESGFTLTEFLISVLILGIISAAVFGMLSDVQRTAAYQAEVQSVVNNAQVALQTVERCIRQAGNNPFGAGLIPVNIISTKEVRIQSDLTGSLGPGKPDKGDPDGDVDDSHEDISIRFNRAARRIELVPAGGSAQIVAGDISNFSLNCFDADGNSTAIGSEVRKIRIVIAAATLLPDPQTHKCFGIEVSSSIRIAS